LPPNQAEGIIDKVKHAVGLGSEKTEEAKQHASDAANTASKQVTTKTLPCFGCNGCKYMHNIAQQFVHQLSLSCILVARV
jgi:hypothetical protein